MLASPSLLAHGRVVVSASRVEVEVTATRHERKNALPVVWEIAWNRVCDSISRCEQRILK